MFYVDDNIFLSSFCALVFQELKTLIKSPFICWFIAIIIDGILWVNNPRSITHPDNCLSYCIYIIVISGIRERSTLINDRFNPTLVFWVVNTFCVKQWSTCMCPRNLIFIWIVFYNRYTRCPQVWD